MEIQYYLEHVPHIVKLLLSYGADVSIKNNLELTALMKTKSVSKGILKLLMEHETVTAYVLKLLMHIHIYRYFMLKITYYRMNTCVYICM